jgi:hypothetical protein
VSNLGEGLQVRVYARAKGNDTSFIMFDRIFNPSTTKEIRLYGLNDDDIFEIEENAHSRIKLRIIGGRGNDTFDIRGHVENLIYDLKAEGNFIKNQSRTKNRFSVDPPSNTRSLLGFNYDYTRFPQFALGYNTDDGLLAGAGMHRRTYGFLNPPYASDQRLRLLWAVDRKAFQVKYQAEINHISRSIDLVMNAEYSAPALKNFFGLGNNTELDESRSNTYYQTRYRVAYFEAMFRQRFFDKFHMQFGPYFYNYNAKYSNNHDNILGDFKEVGMDSANIFSNKSYVGGKVALILDNRNNDLFPTRGMLWINELLMTKGVNGTSKQFMSYTSDMKLYASLTEPAKVVLAMKFGGARIFSKSFEYFQAVNIGANTGLYSFRKNRFSGQGSLYGGLELRVKLIDVNSYILPGALGIMGFYDIGRVFLDGTGKKWHNGFGGGFYYVPFNLFTITATAGVMEGEQIFNFSLSTRFHLTF